MKSFPSYDANRWVGNIAMVVFGVNGLANEIHDGMTIHQSMINYVVFI
jgi:hypothetical protein